jgi:3-phenylpropionate/cinnamic acid dioxygenase small subunit
MTPATEAVSEYRDAVEAMLFLEARLIDTWRLEEWLEMFTEDAMYWLPIDDRKPPEQNSAIIFDTRLRREERVFHLLNHRFASQTPRSRTLHTITNVEIEPLPGRKLLVRSNQVVYEVRTGDFRQTGLGEVRPLVAAVEHVLESAPVWKIASKKVLLIDRDMRQRNLTFIL